MASFDFPEMPAPGSAVSANWGRKVVKCLRQLMPIPGRGMTFAYTPNGTIYNSTPGTKFASAAAVDLKPFDIRWFSKGEDNKDGEWQIYLPLGCVNLTMRTIEAGSFACVCVNEKATDADGEEIYAWYKIDDPEGSKGDTQTINGIVHQSIPVYIWAKPYPRFKITTKTNADDDDFGESFHKQVVGTMNIAEYTVDGETTVSRVGMRVGVETLNLKDESSRYNFNIIYKIDEGDLYKPEAKAKTIVVDMEFSGGRTVYMSDDEEQDVTDWEEVWLKVDHDVEESKDIKISLEKEGKDTTTKVTYIPLYTLKDGVIMTDKRSNLDKISYYDT